jgi:putative ABC transport system ATP-binding protein
MSAPARRFAGAVEAAGLEVAYGGTVALRSLDLTVPAGTMVAVTGSSTAGKSTLLWALAGAVAPTRGGVRVGGEPVTDRVGAAGSGSR